MVKSKSVKRLYLACSRTRGPVEVVNSCQLQQCSGMCDHCSREAKDSTKGYQVILMRLGREATLSISVSRASCFSVPDRFSEIFSASKCCLFP